MCAELLPERITLDDWGYPILDERLLPAELTALAKRAAEACPTFALLSFATSSGIDQPAPAGRVSTRPVRSRGAGVARAASGDWFS